MKIKYRVKDNTAFKERDAQVIGDFLEKTFPNGRFTPEDVVNVAAPVKSPIHKYFEWNDTRAADLYRLQQARRLINCLMVEIKGKQTPRYINVQLEENRGKYLKTEDCLQAPDVWQLVLEKAYSDLNSWRRRYDNFQQLKPVYKVVDRVLKTKGTNNASE